MTTPTQEEILYAYLKEQKIDHIESTEDPNDEEEENKDDGDDDDNGDVEGAHDGEANGMRKLSRVEKKSRKAMLKLGMKPITGVNCVTMKNDKNILFEIMNPDVFKSRSSDTYVFFGEVCVKDMNPQLQTQAAEQFKAPNIDGILSCPECSTNDHDDVDETGMDLRDIELVMKQARVSRVEAIKAIKNANGDLLTAIMELTY